MSTIIPPTLTPSHRTPNTTGPSVRPAFLRSRSASSALSLSSTSSSPSKDKPRLYIALCPRQTSPSTSYRNEVNCDFLHWTLLVAPKTSSRTDIGTRYHVSHNSSQPYHFYAEDSTEDIPPSAPILLRVALAKVIDSPRLQALLRDLPIHANDDEHPSWNCLSWVRSAFIRIVNDGACVKGYVEEKDWKEIERRARTYAKKKRDARRWLAPDGNIPGVGNPDMIPTWNFWENRETAV